MRGSTLLPLALLFAACNSATTTQTIPSISFSTQINITNQQYQALRFDNGVVTLPATGIKLNYLKNSGEEREEGDTAVALVLQNPAARFPDTMRATLTFVR